MKRTHQFLPSAISRLILPIMCGSLLAANPESLRILSLHPITLPRHCHTLHPLLRGRFLIPSQIFLSSRSMRLCKNTLFSIFGLKGVPFHMAGPLIHHFLAVLGLRTSMMTSYPYRLRRHRGLLCRTKIPSFCRHRLWSFTNPADIRLTNFTITAISHCTNDVLDLADIVESRSFDVWEDK